ncbi:hypothetical protein CSC71_04280 [Pseudoxanthomonas sangjuensis]|nr:hypothetical protein CSC71_04280 [Pseudoxanthomonas sangjuensis]
MAFAGFCALGAWQVKRLAWKLDLIERVESRVHAVPTEAPGPETWAAFDAKGNEYRHVYLYGEIYAWMPAYTQAVTEQGPGYWMLLPYKTEQGWIVWVNKGFVPPDYKREFEQKMVDPAPGYRRITGLLRVTEPGGGFLRKNDPANGRWFSRDVEAISAANHLGNIAPYFVDADYDASAPQWPRGGMTVVKFRNSHLSYALTWFALALLAAFAFWRFAREGRPSPR